MPQEPKKISKQLAYNRRLKAAGFKPVQVIIHESNLQILKEFVSKNNLREPRKPILTD